MARALEVNIDELNKSQLLLHEKAIMLEDEIAERQVVQEDLADKQRMLESLNHTLEERIETAVKELRQMDQALIQQNRLASMGEMINNIAHQWRQPLNLIGLIVQGLPMCKILSQAELDHEVERIMDVILHMSQTIDDFRYFFRQDKEKTRFTANQAVAKAVEFISPSLNNKGISIFNIDQPEVGIFGYCNEYEQVLLNILSNAKDVLVERNVAEPCIGISISSAEDRSVVTITDNGGGISTDVMPKIFDPYFTTKDKMQGTGIGLYMSKMIIEQNMGAACPPRMLKAGSHSASRFKLKQHRFHPHSALLRMNTDVFYPLQNSFPTTPKVFMNESKALKFQADFLRFCQHFNLYKVYNNIRKTLFIPTMLVARSRRNNKVARRFV